jgi:arabinofuranosyltransferase
MFGYAAGTDVAVEDRFGLADPLAAHQELGIRGLPGHEKRLEQEWMVARFAAPKVQLPPTVDKERVAAARRALACGQLPELLASTTEPLDAGRITDNLLDSFTLWRSRFPPTPTAAESRLCGEHRR